VLASKARTIVDDMPPLPCRRLTHLLLAGPVLAIGAIWVGHGGGVVDVDRVAVVVEVAAWRGVGGDGHAGACHGRAVGVKLN
jgi:hypothetical protein